MVKILRPCLAMRVFSLTRVSWFKSFSVNHLKALSLPLLFGCGLSINAHGNHQRQLPPMCQVQHQFSRLSFCLCLWVAVYVVRLRVLVKDMKKITAFLLFIELNVWKSIEIKEEIYDLVAENVTDKKWKSKIATRSSL